MGKTEKGKELGAGTVLNEGRKKEAVRNKRKIQGEGRNTENPDP